MWGLYLFFLSGVGGEKEEERRSGEEEKSNNPNLKGGEKTHDYKICGYLWIINGHSIDIYGLSVNYL